MQVHVNDIIILSLVHYNRGCWHTREKL